MSGTAGFLVSKYYALRLIFLLSLAIFPPETLKMLANTKVLPALFNVPDEKLSQREKLWLFFRRKRPKCSPIQKYCLRFSTSPTKNYLNEKSCGCFSAGNAKNARQYKSIACAFQRPRQKITYNDNGTAEIY